MGSQDVQKLAEKIAKAIEAESQAPDIASLFASIEKINHRLDKLETSSNPPSLLPIQPSHHPSLDKFAVVEAIADEIFGKLQKEKACTFEPNGKPCDHCSMCSSRGF